MTLPHPDIPLSDLRRRQSASAVAELLDVEPALVLSSTYVRAIETARPFSEKAGCPITLHPLLHEFSALDAGLVIGMVTAERRPLADAFWGQTDPDLRHGPGSQSFREFSDRVAGFVDEDAAPAARHGSLWARYLVRAPLLEALGLQCRRRNSHA